MNSRKRIGKWIATLVVITVTGFSAAALAQQGMQHGQMGSGGQGWGSNWQQNMGKMQKINPNMGRGMMPPGSGHGMMMQPGSGRGMMQPGGGQGMMQPSN